MSKKHTPQHDFWYPKVEGQIKHVMGRHPEYFRLSKSNIMNCIESLSKRIVGEIVAVNSHGNNAALYEVICAKKANSEDATYVSRRRERRIKRLGAPMPLTWYRTDKLLPEKGSSKPYLLVYSSQKNSRKVTIGVWAGTKWKFLAPRYKLGISENVTHWALYPEPPKSII